jgi:ribosomal protein L11 methyltransferase
MIAIHIVKCGGLSYGTAEDLTVKFESFGAVAATINETDEAAAIWEAVGYFETEDAAELARGAIGLEDATTGVLAEIDWVRRSLEGLAPVAAGRFFLHGSHDRTRRRAGGISLEINAGTAFGTGHHGTTLGCLLAFDRLIKRERPRWVLDLGCGTGVLALAAARALRRQVFASDIDVEALRVTLFNARRNGAGPFVRAVTAPGLGHPMLRQGAPYDLIFANILARPLVGLAQGIAWVLKPGGTLILSGITQDQEHWVAAAYRNRGLIPEPAIRLGSWSTLLFAKKKSARRSGRGLRKTRRV